MASMCKSSDVGNSDILERSLKVLPVSEKVLKSKKNHSVYRVQYIWSFKYPLGVLGHIPLGKGETTVLSASLHNVFLKNNLWRLTPIRIEERWRRRKRRWRGTCITFYGLLPATMGNRQQWYSLFISQARDLSHTTVNIFLNVYTSYVM